MREQRIKSIYYKLISLGYDIYLGENTSEFFVVKHCCSICRSSWYMNLTECYFCGMINSYLYYCRTCKNYSSTTGGSAVCSTCKQKRKKICFNDKCITNQKEFLEEFSKKNGVMDKNSPSATSQSHCINCGSDQNLYSSSLVCLKEVKENEKVKIDNDLIKKYNALIFVQQDNTKYLVVNKNSKKEDLKKFKDELDLSILF